MRLICILFIFLFSSSVNAQITEARLKTLLSICETAQSNSDLGTIKILHIRSKMRHYNQIKYWHQGSGPVFRQRMVLKQLKLMLKV